MVTATLVPLVSPATTFKFVPKLISPSQLVIQETEERVLLGIEFRLKYMEKRM